MLTPACAHLAFGFGNNAALSPNRVGTRCVGTDAVGDPIDSELAARQMMRLTSGLAHELRNPLNNAKLQLDVLLRERREPTLPPMVVERVQRALTELRRIAATIDDYVSLTEPRDMKPRSTAVLPLVEGALRTLGSAIDAAGTTVQIAVPVELPQVWVDPNRMQQALEHLIRNGLEAVQGLSNGLVSVAATAEATTIRITVSDNGEGVPSEMLESIFDPFVTTKPTGTGLGLTLVRQLALAHGGAATVTSEFGCTVALLELPRA